MYLFIVLLVPRLALCVRFLAGYCPRFIMIGEIPGLFRGFQLWSLYFTVIEVPIPT